MNQSTDLSKRKYTGNGECNYEPLDDAWEQPEPYIPSESLIKAVNTALYLRRPLLIEGDPGCGKTRLAYAVAYELGYPLHECYIRSTSLARDLLYNYDALRRLYDIQEARVQENHGEYKPREEYVELGELGQAIKDSENDIPSVVLIDEIDKADIDFPNDLLLELDRLQFQVKEAPQKYDALKGKTRKERREFLPLIIITSNREKELPRAFLRRCLFYYLNFPDESTLEKIVTSHFQPSLTPLFQEALKRFWQLRQQTKWRKSPGTSEFLDWLAVLEANEKTGKITAETIASYQLQDLPYLETLVKTQSDLNELRNKSIN